MIRLEFMFLLAVDLIFLYALLRLDEQSIKYTDNKDKVTIEILKHSDVIDTLIVNMMSLFNQLELDYPKNVKIYKEEI